MTPHPPLPDRQRSWRDYVACGTQIRICVFTQDPRRRGRRGGETWTQPSGDGSGFCCRLTSACVVCPLPGTLSLSPLGATHDLDDLLGKVADDLQTI